VSSRDPALTLSLLTIGFVSILGQVVLLRELSVAFYGVELVYLLGLGTWLLWSATGAALAHRRLRPSPAGVAALLLLFALLLLAGVAWLRAARPLLSGLPGAYLPFERGFVALVVALAPVGLLLGLLFQWAAKLLVAAGGTLAEAYAIESVGGVMGGLAATLGLAWGLDAVSLALLCSLAAVGAAGLCLRGSRRGVRAALGLLALAGLALLVRAPEIDRHMTRWNHLALVESRDSPYARITLTRRADQTAIFVNDALAFETEGTEAESFVHPVLLQHPSPSSVLVLGGCAEGIVAEVLRHRPRSVDCVELDPVLLGLALRHLPAPLARPLGSPGVRLVRADPRRFLHEAPRYDVILVGMPDPDSGQANRFYTREFFEQCAKRLNAPGILGLRLRSAEDFWAPPLARRMASVGRALESPFGHVLFLPGSTSVVVASREDLLRDPTLLAARLHSRGIDGRLVGPRYLEYVYSDARLAALSQRLRSVVAPANTDRRPVCYSYAALIWLSRFFPRLAYAAPAAVAGEGAFTRAGAVALLAALFALLLARRSPAWRRVGLVGIAGFVGMVAESVLILHYQSVRGALFQDLGVLITSFMAGLALGSWGVYRLREVSRGSDARARQRGAALLLALGGLNLLIAHEARTGLLAALPGVAGLLLAGGLLVGAVLAHASLAGVSDRAGVVSPLYAADLMGGCLGGLAASLVLIPVFGLEGTASGMAALALACLLLL
jgi:spermidine synthase